MQLKEGEVAFVMAQIALLNCEVAGMQAENTQRLNHGYSLAYGENEFASVRQKYEALLERIWVAANEL